MAETIQLNVGGMTCDGCAGRVRDAIEGVSGVESAVVSHEQGNAVVIHSGISRDLLTGAVRAIGYTVDGQGDDFHWGDGSVWKQSANNTKWCLIGCSIGEFGTLAAYQYYGIHHHVSWDLINPYSSSFDLYIIFLFLLPLINGLATSVMLETTILMRGQMDFRNALSTAFGMSFISMLMMEIAMEITDLMYTGGQLGLDPMAVIPMLFVGFITPWPYNYWRLKKYGMACH
jgi:copper chaperone CopZ